MSGDRQTRMAVAAVAAFLAGGPLRLPAGMGDLWSMFMDLHQTRGLSESGPQPITFAEIDAYARLHRWPLAPHHIALIRALDGAWLTHARRQRSGGKGTLPSGPAPSINPAAFDAVFG